MIGSGNVNREEVRPAESSYEPIENLDSQLDFYDELSKPIGEEVSNQPVTIPAEVPKPKTEPEIVVQQRSDPAEKESVHSITVQVAALSTREEAEQFLIRLSAKGFEGRIHPPATSTGDKYYRVWVGEFSTNNEAESFASQLKEEGFHTYIRRIQ
jgi:cell division protein FtsN